MKVSHSKNEFKQIHTRYIQYNYTFFHKVVCKQKVFINFSLMVSVQTVKV